jgi:hypothetical protein
LRRRRDAPGAPPLGAGRPVDATRSTVPASRSTCSCSANGLRSADTGMWW